jgi:hypothetical protein
MIILMKKNEIKNSVFGGIKFQISSYEKKKDLETMKNIFEYLI